MLILIVLSGFWLAAGVRMFAEKEQDGFSAWWAWGKVDPEASLTAAMEQKDLWSGVAVLGAIVKSDPVRAREVIEQYPQFRESRAMTGLAAGLMRADLGCWRCSGGDHGTHHSINHENLVSTWASRDPDAALAWAQSLPDQPRHTEALDVLITQWAATNPEKIVPVIAGLPEERTKWQLYAEPIALVAGQQLRFTYNLTIQIGGVPGVTDTTTEGDSVGWPIDYSISNITTNGTKMVVTTSEAHHYAVGGKVNPVGVVMPRTAITAATSTVSNFTITTPGHFKSAGNSIVIQGVTPSAYNGTFTVASVSGNDIIVTSALNPGAGTVFGTVRFANPSPWFDGEWTVAAVPTSTTFEITTAITPPTPNLPEGIAHSNVKRKFRAIKYGIEPINATTAFRRCCDAFCDGFSEYGTHGFFDGSATPMHLGRLTTQAVTLPSAFPVYWVDTNAVNSAGSAVQSGISNGSLSTSGNLFAITGSLQSYTRGSFFRDNVIVIPAGSGNASDTTQFWYGRAAASGSNPGRICALFLFEERQKKDSVHKLTLTVRRRWARDLSVEP